MRKTALFSVFLIVLLACSFYLPFASATPIFEDGFESGDFSAFSSTSVGGSGSSLTVQSSVVHHGTYAAASHVETGGGYANFYKELGGSYDELYVRAYIKLTALPSSGNRLFIGPSTEIGGVDYLALEVYNDAGTVKWDLWFVSSNVHVYSSSTVQTNTWYCVEIYHKAGSGNGIGRLYVNGDLAIEKTDATLPSGISQLGFGAWNHIGDTSVTLYMDCVVVADAYIGTEEEEQNVIVDLPETCAVSASLETQKNLYRTSSETVTVTSAVGISKTMTKTAGEITDLTWSLETQKTLTRTTGESTSITTTFESVKSITAVVAELSETISVSASLLVQKAIHILATGTVELTAILDVAKHLHAILVSLLETLPFSGYLEALLPEIELTTEEVLVVCVALIVMFFSVAVGLVFMKRRKE